MRLEREAATPLHTHADEQDLMKAMAENDPSALALLHDRHAATIFAFCLRILRNAEEADEVLEDVFFQLWQRADQYDARRGSVLAYLVTLARSRATERARRSSRREGLRRAVGDGVVRGALVDLSSADATPLQDALDHERRRHVRSALAEIPARERVALELSFLDGLSHSEIARQLGEPLGTVKTRIRSGFLRLRESLAALVGGETS